MRRRELLLGLTAGAGALVAPVRARADERRRVLILGSSAMAGAFGGALEHGLERLGYQVHRRHRSASSLSRPDFFDWYAEAQRLYESFRPHGTLVMFAANDAQALFTGGKPAWIQFHDEDAWTRAYRDRVNEFVDTLAPRGERVVWIGAPIMRSPKLSARMRRTNQIYAEEMRWRPAATFVDTWGHLADRRGHYSDRIRVGGSTKLVRSPDGVHLARAGARVLADVIVPRADDFFTQRLARVRDADAPCASPHPGTPASPSPDLVSTTG